MLRKMARGILQVLPMKERLFKSLRDTASVPERVYRHLYFQGPMTVRIDDATEFQLIHWGNQIENDIFWAGLGNNWEGTTLRLWLLLARQAGLILDIGANTGVFALCAKAINPRADVIALEPVARVYDRLVRNIALNGFDIDAVCAGASDVTGVATLFDVDSGHVYSASLEQKMLAGRQDVVEAKVPIVRVDELLAERCWRGTMLAKVDTERHESKVIEGFGSLIHSHRPVFVVEILDREIGNRIERHFKDKAYTYFEVIERVAVRRTSSLGAGERNYLICPNEVAHQLQLGGEVRHVELELARHRGVSAVG